MPAERGKTRCELRNEGMENLVATRVDAKTGRHVVAFEFVTAPRAELIGRPNSSEAVSATGSELVIALRAEVKVALHMSAARRAS